PRGRDLTRHDRDGTRDRSRRSGPRRRGRGPAPEGGRGRAPVRAAPDRAAKGAGSVPPRARPDGGGDAVRGTLGRALAGRGEDGRPRIGLGGRDQLVTPAAPKSAARIARCDASSGDSVITVAGRPE